MLREVASASAMVLFTATSLIAQDSVRWRWGIGGGLSYMTGKVRFYQPGSGGYRYVPDQPLITGASRYFGHVTVGASRRHPTTAITSRIDLLYNRGESMGLGSVFGTAGPGDQIAWPGIWPRWGDTTPPRKSRAVPRIAPPVDKLECPQHGSGATDGRAQVLSPSGSRAGRAAASR